MIFPTGSRPPYTCFSVLHCGFISKGLPLLAVGAITASANFVGEYGEY